MRKLCQSNIEYLTYQIRDDWRTRTSLWKLSFMTRNCCKDFRYVLRQGKVFVLNKESIHAPEVYGVEKVLYIDVENKAPSPVN